MHFNRIISLVLVIALTCPICYQTDLFARRTDYSNKVKAVSQESGTYTEAEITSGLTREFESREKDIDRLISAAEASGDTDFGEQVNTVFTRLYSLLKKVILSGGSIEYSDVENELTDIFNSLFALDTKLNEISPEAMGDLTNRGFVTQAISIVWDIVTAFDKSRVASQTMETGVTRLEDIPYIDDGTNEHMLDVYYPEGTNEKLPVIIDIHGGGLMMGDKDSNKIYCSVLAKRGYTVVCVNYRLSPDVLYPSQVQDIMAAFKWVNDNADSYNIDLDKVYVTGDSAGGNLAYYVPLVETSPELCELYGVSPSGLQIDALGLVSGMYDMKTGVNAPLISCYFGFDYKNSPYYPYLQPEEVLPLGELPPCYMVSCSRDFLHSSAEHFDSVLTEQGIEHVYRDWGLTVNKSSGHITSVAYPDLEESQQTIDEMLEFFQMHTK